MLVMKLWHILQLLKFFLRNFQSVWESESHVSRGGGMAGCAGRFSKLDGLPVKLPLVGLKPGKRI
jgi:hypothetical protein